MMLPHGYLLGEDERLLNLLATDCKLAIDLGTCNGKSAVILSQRAEKVVTVDLFEDFNLITNEGSRAHYKNIFDANPHYYDDVKKNLAEFTNIEVLKENTAEAANRFTPLSVDLVFFDGDHSFSGLSQDVYNWILKVKHNGYLLFHDGTDDRWDVRNYCDLLPVLQPVHEIKSECTASSIRMFQKL